jgi:hypothetical protein
MDWVENKTALTGTGGFLKGEMSRIRNLAVPHPKWSKLAYPVDGKGVRDG